MDTLDEALLGRRELVCSLSCTLVEVPVVVFISPQGGKVEPLPNPYRAQAPKTHLPQGHNITLTREIL